MRATDLDVIVREGVSANGTRSRSIDKSLQNDLVKQSKCSQIANFDVIFTIDGEKMARSRRSLKHCVLRKGFISSSVPQSSVRMQSN